MDEKIIVKYHEGKYKYPSSRMRSRANYLKVYNNSDSALLSGVCHGGAVGAFPHLVGVCTLAVPLKGYGPEEKRFYEYLFNESIFAPVFLTKTYEDAIEKGIFVDATGPYHLVMSALQISRVSTSEWSGAFNTTLKILRYYPVNPLGLLMLSISLGLTVDKQGMICGRTAPITTSAHLWFRPSEAVKVKGIESIVKGDIRHQLVNPPFNTGRREIYSIYDLYTVHTKDEKFHLSGPPMVLGEVLESDQEYELLWPSQVERFKKNLKINSEEKSTKGKSINISEALKTLEKL
jgi:hypothetical protein